MTTKVAVVTASDSGIGKQCALQLAQKGFSLGVTWHSDEQGARQTVQEHTPLPQASAYTAAKHALGGLTKSLALELVKHNILVNSVAPGAIATAMNNMQDDEVKPGSMPNIPMARPGKTEEIAGLVAWLSSDEASYVTGQSLIVDGGFTLVNPQFLNEQQA
jgi:NAD(P)-dependent dehydrogenase (short-subunit alcohol dehydrogenase family)